MGIVRMGPPERLVTSLRDALGAKTFIETGTFRGVTTEWASGLFEQVHSIERAEGLYREAKAKLAGIPNIELHLGDTRSVLPGLIQGLDAPAVLWLDAHWCGRDTSGRQDECPLLDELAIADGSAHALAILIDDARYFLSAPPAPHNLDQWPDLATVVDTLARGHERYLAVTEDVIVGVPMAARDVVVEHCRDVATRALQTKSAFRRKIRRATRRLRDLLRGQSRSSDQRV